MGEASDQQENSRIDINGDVGPGSAIGGEVRAGYIAGRDINISKDAGISDDETSYREQLVKAHSRLQFIGLAIRRPKLYSADIEALLIYPKATRRTQRPVMTFRSDAGEIKTKPLANLDQFDSLSRLDLGDEMKVWMAEVEEQIVLHTAVSDANIVILGDPGAGKTTFLQFLTLLCAEGRAAELNLDQDLLPIFVPLRSFAAHVDVHSLIEYFSLHSRLQHAEMSPGFFRQALEAGQCLVCLDGLDEVGSIGLRHAVVDAVELLQARYPGNRYLITSRKVGYDEAMLDPNVFTQHTILPFADDDISKFVHKWYTVHQPDLYRRDLAVADLTTAIASRPRVRDLARNPLLLTVIAVIHYTGGHLPQKRATLYERCVETLIETWDEDKRIESDFTRCDFYHRRERLLRRLAYCVHASSQTFEIKRLDLEILLGEIIQQDSSLPFAQDFDGARNAACEMIAWAEQRAGLLVERSMDLFVFSHPSLQEYLAAWDIEHRFIQKPDRMWEEIKDKLFLQHWREVILLLLARLGKYDIATDMIERILEVGQSDPYEPILHRHLYLVAQALSDQVEVSFELRKQVADDLLAIAQDEANPGREDALLALSWQQDHRHIGDALIALARDESRSAGARCGFAAVLVIRPLDQTKEAQQVLSSLARDKMVKDNIRLAAAQILAHSGCEIEAVDVLMAMVPNPFLRQKAMLLLNQWMVEVDSEACRALLALMDNPVEQDWVRYAAALTLGRLGIDKAKLVLVELASASNVFAEIRINAADALWRLEYRQDVALRVLREIALNATDGQGQVAVFYIGGIGPVREAVDMLEFITLNAAKELVRVAAIRVLGQMALDGNRRITDFIQRIAQTAPKDTYAHEVASVWLVRLRIQESADVGALRNFLEQTNHIDVARAATDRLLELATQDTAEAEDILREITLNANMSRLKRSAAASSLSKITDADDIQVVEVIEVLGHMTGVDVTASFETAEALKLMASEGNEEAIDALCRFAHDSDTYVSMRYAAINVLGSLRTEKVRGTLLAIARDGSLDAELRVSAYISLRQNVGSPVNFAYPIE